MNNKDYIFYYSGTKEKAGQESTGFLLTKKVRKYIMNYELHNERLCKIRLKRKYKNITLINAYAHTEDKHKE